MNKESPEYKAALRNIILKYKKSFLLGEFMFKNNLECIDCTVDEASDIKGEAKNFLESTKGMILQLEEMKAEIKKISEDGHELP